MGPRSKILSHDRVDAWIAAERSAGRRIGFTCGTFDVLHAGHVQYLARAKSLCDRLLVAVNTDDSVRRYKSPLRPINPEDERMYVIAALAAVDVVTRLEENRPLSLLLRWKPDLYVKGGDYAASSLKSGDAVREYGGAVEVIRPEFDSSTTRLMERIAALGVHAQPERAPEHPATGLVLLDRDGTLIRDVPYLHEPARVELNPGVVEGLIAMQAAGLRLAIATNQQGIGLGYYGIDDFIAVNQRILRELGTAGVHISRIYFCPHSSADGCACRKPASGMIERAMREFDAAPDRTFFIGDTGADMLAAASAGVRTAYVGTAGDVTASFRAADFRAAAAWVAAQVARERVSA